jgi:hypothetical protein
VVIKNLAKSSVLLLFLRIFPDPRFRLFTKIALVWIVCNAFAFTVALTLQCIPVVAVWDLSINGQCINSGAVVFVGAGLSIFEDVVIILLPIMELKGLTLSLRRRLGIMLLFAMASLSVNPYLFNPILLIFRQALTSSSATITSMVRLKYIVDYQIRSLDATCTFVFQPLFEQTLTMK